ncbi:MAG: ABC transporter ATP-binding protein [Actinobacteria bacterium]|nr:ABC transporter ATP-binding protein [Actinomycetota bacterium]
MGAETDRTTAGVAVASPGGANAEKPGFRAEGICVHFEGVKAVDGVDVTIVRGEVLGLLGPNGAGKTTLVNALTGFEKPTAGQVWLGERDITGMEAARLARLGVARTFQSGRLFDHLTVLENVEVAALTGYRTRRRAVARAREILAMLELSHIADRRARELSHGESRNVELGRLIATSASYLLLDEPAAGLNEAESDQLTTLIASLPERLDCGVLIIEHDMRVIMRLCHRIQVLDHGKTIAVGTPEEIRADAAVNAAYLGSVDNEAAGENDAAS